MERKRKDEVLGSHTELTGPRQRRRVSTSGQQELSIAFLEKTRALLMANSDEKELLEHLRRLLISKESAATIELVDAILTQHKGAYFKEKEPVHERTLLHETACAGNLRTAALFLRHGADPAIQDRFGRPALGPHELTIIESLVNDEGSSDDEEFDADADSQESEDSASEDDRDESGKDGDDEVENEASDEATDGRRTGKETTKGSPQIAPVSRTSSAASVTRKMSALEGPGPAKKPAPSPPSCQDTEEDEAVILAPSSTSFSESPTPSASNKGAAGKRASDDLSPERFREIDATIGLIAVICEMEGQAPMTPEAVDKLVVRALAADDYILTAFRNFRTSPPDFRARLLALLSCEVMDVNET